MGKSTKLIKAFLKVLKVSSKDQGCSATEDFIYASGPLTLPSQSREHDQKKCRGKGRSRWSLGRSTSRNWESDTVDGQTLHKLETGQESGSTRREADKEPVNGKEDLLSHIVSVLQEEASHEGKQPEHRHSPQVCPARTTEVQEANGTDDGLKESQVSNEGADRGAKPSLGDFEEDDEEGDFVVKNFSGELGGELLSSCVLVSSQCKQASVDWAASVIQTAFRGYLARRALRALKGLVRLQALARGRLVRRQAAATLRCVHALVRVQARVRARRVRMSEEGLAVQHKLQHRRRAPPPTTMQEEWDSSPATPQQLQARAQYKQVAAMKRERALAYAFSEQLRRCAPKQSSLVIDCQGDKNHWGWRWLERWMAARPWESSCPGLAREHVSVMNVMDANLLNPPSLSFLSGSKGCPSPPKSSPFVRKRSLSISECLLNHLESIPSPTKLTPPALRICSYNCHPLSLLDTTNASSPSRRSLTLPFDASQPLLSSSYRLRLSLPNLSPVSAQKSSIISAKACAASSFRDCGATVDKDRIVAEALKDGPREALLPNPRRSQDDGIIGCESKEMSNGGLSCTTATATKQCSNMKVTNAGSGSSKGSAHEKGKGRAVRRQPSAAATSNCVDLDGRPQASGRTYTDEREEPQYSKAGSLTSPAVPSYMQSTQSAVARARPVTSPRSSKLASPAKKPDGSAGRRRSSLSPGLEARAAPSGGRESGMAASAISSQRFLLTNARSKSSRTLAPSFSVRDLSAA